MQTPTKINLVKLYVPANPFESLVDIVWRDAPDSCR